MVKPPTFQVGNCGFKSRRPYYDSRANAEMTTFIETEKPMSFLFLSPKNLWKRGETVAANVC